MRVSLLISLIIHLLIVIGLFYVFKVVPEMRLPAKIYNVKILQPIIRAREQQAEVKEEVKKPAPAKPKEKKPKEKPKEEPKPAPKEEERPLDVSVEKEQTSLVVDGQRFPFSYYLDAVERKVSQNWFSAVSAGGEGLSCVVYFSLRRDGSVSDTRIEQSSGNAYFDRTALRAVRSASPFPPLPRAFSESYLGIHFTFLQKD
jgi:TonB family protein